MPKNESTFSTQLPDSLKKRLDDYKKKESRQHKDVVAAALSYFMDLPTSEKDKIFREYLEKRQTLVSN